MKKIISCILIAFILISVAGCSKPGADVGPTDTGESIYESSADNTEEVSESTEIADDRLYHVEYLFRKICFGMTYEEVCEAMGSEGELLEDEGIVAKVYRWLGKDDLIEENKPGSGQKVKVFFNEIDDQLVVTKYWVYCDARRISKTYDEQEVDLEDMPSYENLSYVEKEVRKLHIGLDLIELINIFGEPTAKAGSGTTSYIYRFGDEGTFSVIMHNGVAGYLVLSPLYQM